MILENSSSQSQDQFKYQQDERLIAMQQQRRLQMMKKVGYKFDDQQQQQISFANQNQNNSSINPFAKDQTDQMKKKFQKEKSKKDQQYQKALVLSSAKKLRAQDSQLYFETMNAQLHLSFTKPIAQVLQIKQIYENEFPFIFQHFNENNIKDFIFLKSKNPIDIQPEQILTFLKKLVIQTSQQIKNKRRKKLFDSKIILWLFCIHLKIGLRKINLFDISKSNLESIFNLNYNPSKKFKRNIQKTVMEMNLKNKLQNLQLNTQGNQFQDIQSYAYNPNSITTDHKLRKTQSMTRQQKRRKLIKDYCNNFYQIFSPSKGQWVIINGKDYSIVSIEELKQVVYQGRAILGFFSTRVLNVQKESKLILDFRQLKDIEIKDLTQIFADSMKQILKRRNRIRAKAIYRQYLRLGKFQSPKNILEPIDKMIIEIDQQKQKKQMIEKLPKSKKQMKLSQYFTTPSLMDKYKILRQGATDLGINFYQQKVYLKKDLIKATSRLIWIDYGRMIKQGEKPLKIVQNRQKDQTQLFTYVQTQPFRLKINNQTGKFVEDEQYSSIYVPPKQMFQVPQQCMIVEDKISYVCKKYEFIHSRVVQGFKRENMKVVPNNIGFLIYKKDYDDIMKYQRERVAKLQENKQRRERQVVIKGWKKLFSDIIISQGLKKQRYS